jgi:hypothetical protein
VILVIAWAIAAAFALIVGGVCAYEIRWKANRLRRDVADFEPVVAQLRNLQAELASIVARS